MGQQRNQPGWPRAARPGLLLLSLGLYLGISGCGSITVQDSTPTAPPTATAVRSAAHPAGSRHDLAILGVDFDPGLDVQTLLDHKPVNLVIGVSNQGDQRELAVQVRADLWDASGSRLLLHAEQTVDSIAAGNLLPVHLTSRDTPPYYTRYHLTVQIVPVAGETSTANNSRSLDIAVNTAH